MAFPLLILYVPFIASSILPVVFFNRHKGNRTAVLYILWIALSVVPGILIMIRSIMIADMDREGSEGISFFYIDPYTDLWIFYIPLHTALSQFITSIIILCSKAVKKIA